MKTSSVRSLAAAVSVLLLIGPPQVLAQTPRQTQVPEKIGVQIIIDTTPVGFREEVVSYYMRELRSITDVAIVDAGAEYKIVVNVLQLKTTNGFATGWVAAETYYTRYTFPGLADEGRAQCTGSTCQLLIKMLVDAWQELDEQMGSFGNDGLRAHAQEAIAHFDGRFLESHRKLMSQLQQLQQLQNRAPPNQPKGR